jgi:hypothetical protein
MALIRGENPGAILLVFGVFHPARWAGREFSRLLILRGTTSEYRGSSRRNFSGKTYRHLNVACMFIAYFVVRKM